MFMNVYLYSYFDIYNYKPITFQQRCIWYFVEALK